MEDTNQKLQQELAILRQTIDEHAILSEADATGKITHVNDLFCQISGYTKEELLGNNHRLLKSEIHPPEFYENLWETISSGKTWNGVICNRKKDGSYYWVRSTIHPIIDRNGIPFKYLSVRTDVTELKESEEQLHLLTQALNSSSVGVIIIDASRPEYPIVDVNCSFESITGFEEHEILEAGYQTFFLNPKNQEIIQKNHEAVIQGKPSRTVLQEHKKDGTEYWIEFILNPVKNNYGTLNYFVGVLNDITERQKLLTSLEEKEERLRRSQDYANIGTWDWNIQTGDLFWSEKIAPLFGYTDITETKYENFMNAVHPEDRQAVNDAVQNCLHLGIKYCIEHRVVHSDGSIHWVLEQGDVTRDENGTPLRMLGVVQDITNLKTTEFAVKESERKLAIAQRVAHLGSYDWEITTGELNWSDEHYRLFGIEPFSVKPSFELFLQYIHQDDLNFVKKNLQNALDGVEEYDCVHRIVDANGNLKWCRGIGATTFDHKFNAIRMYGTIQDITALKSAEIERAKMESRNSALMAGAQDAIFVTTMNGQFIDANAKACELTGYTLDELITLSTAQIHPESEQELLKSAFQDIREKGHSKIRHQVLRKNGTTVVCDVVGTLLSFGDEQLAFGVFRDATEQIEREEKINLARTEAERANKAKSAFLANMSHELRTPLNAILGFAQLLEIEPTLTVNDKENTQEILRAGRHLLELINEILDLAKIESEKLDLNIEKIVFKELAKDCNPIIQTLAKTKNITIEMNECQNITTPILVDKLRIKQVLLNLLSNAVKYNKEGGKVSLSVCQKDEGFLRFEIVDTGIGIPLETQHEVFTPFYRGEATKMAIEGTGIGLVISKRLVEAMGGKIGFMSTPNIGSTFWVDIPIVETETTLSNNLEAYTQENKIYNRENDDTLIKVLYVEDNPQNLFLVEKIISTMHNFKFYSAATPSEGIKIAEEIQPNIIILDIGLPEMSGMELLQILKNNPRIKDVPYIALSANIMESDIEKGLAAGFDIYMSKPLKIENFINTLNLLLKDGEK